MFNNTLNDPRNLMSMDIGQQMKNSYSKPEGFKSGPFKKRLTKEENKKLKRTHCMESGHEINDCFKLHGKPHLTGIKGTRKTECQLESIWLIMMRMECHHMEVWIRERFPVRRVK